ncbi:MAG: hypothetical protein Edafosvirus27_3 [Edafosvirus sp.]|uniref:Uncharacterized protein n=1 Tax=Edafosvirus sp. TaxID=2487765 RepID=A0A3G4ZWI1_9VIRU|nr:MAG: hypothetical protein Edafosvirus27_3 [Edafosvirus sp.]
MSTEPPTDPMKTFTQFMNFFKNHPIMPSIITDMANQQLRTNILNNFGMLDFTGGVGDEEEKKDDDDDDDEKNIVDDETVLAFTDSILEGIFVEYRSRIGESDIEKTYAYFDMSNMFRKTEPCVNAFLNNFSRIYYHENEAKMTDKDMIEKAIQQISDSAKAQHYTPYKNDREKHKLIKQYKKIAPEIINVYKFEKKLAILHNDVKKLYTVLDNEDVKNLLKFVTQHLANYVSTIIKKKTVTGYLKLVFCTFPTIFAKKLDTFYAGSKETQTIDNFLKCWIIDEFKFGPF